MDAVGLVLLKAGVSVAVLASGFRAVSDDDYARVTIAERFADAPQIDPTGTSWLPLPFYVYGAALRVFGNSLTIATALAVVLGVVSALLCWSAARIARLSRCAAFAAGAICALLPYSAYLGAAPVPEAPTAALCVLGAATLGRIGNLRVLGAAALFAACASRYEAWAVAIAFTAFTLRDAVRTRERHLWLAAALAALFPVMWLLHGIVRHGDAMFFIARVTAYRAALAGTESLLERWLRTPRGLALGEPELAVAFFLGALPLTLMQRGFRSRALQRLLVALAALVVLLMLGDVRGSAPTHHGERALLAVWFGMVLVSARAAEFVVTLPWKPKGFAMLWAVLLLLAVRVRQEFPREPFVNRSDAVAIGQRARERAFERLAIDSEDYAFFAIQAAFGHPARTTVLDDHDPRKTRPAPWTSDPQGLSKTLRSARIPALALPRSRAPFAHAVGSVSEENNGFLLIELRVP
ncbi:MAG: hypothetical protein ACOY0T_19445 [Myxococcota bacterium]